MSDAIERFLNWKRELDQKLWPLPLLSPLYDAGLLMGVFKLPPQYPNRIILRKHYNLSLVVSARNRCVK
jgi:hypothetical protein